MPAPLSPKPYSATRPSWLALGALVAATLAAYSGSLRAPFVYDDVQAIPGNPTIRHLWPLSDVVSPQATGGLTVSGRPLLNLSFAINYAVSGEAVWSYHVFNVAVHLGAGLLLFGIVRRTLNRLRAEAECDRPSPGLVPFVITALWLLHPLQTQAITYTVQRAESLMAFFYLFTLYAMVRATEPIDVDKDNGQRTGWLVLSIVACVLGMATKEVMATAPLLVLLYDRTFVAGSFRDAWRQRRGYYLALAGTWIFLGALILSTGGNRGGTVGLGVGVPWWGYPATQFRAITRYLALSFWPKPLVFEYGTFWVRQVREVAPYAPLVIALLAGTGVALWRRPVLGFLGAWFFLILAPTSLAPGTIQMIVEHRMYLPLAAVIALVVGKAQAWLGRGAVIALGVVALVCAGVTYRRNQDYRSHLALWSDTVAKRPDNPRAHEGLAEAYAELGRLDDAIREHAETVRLKPEESTYHYNLALKLAEAHRLDEAIHEYELSLRLTPNEANAHNNLGIALVQAGQFAAAVSHYAEAVRLKPGSAQFHYNHGIGLLRVERFREAAAEFESALALRPDDADAHFNLAGALARLDRLPDALPHFAAAVRLAPTDAEFRAGLAQAHFAYGNQLIGADRVPAAVEQYENALRLAPDHAEAHHNLGVAHARLEHWSDARREFETALRLQPDYAEARRHLEQLQRVPAP